MREQAVMRGCSCGGGPPVYLGEAPATSGGAWVLAVLGAGVVGLAAYAAARGTKKSRRRRGPRRVEIYEGGRRRYAEV